MPRAKKMLQKTAVAQAWLGNRQCLLCGVPLVRRPQERVDDCWLARRTCSAACRKAHSVRGEWYVAKRPEPRRTALPVAADAGFSYSQWDNSARRAARAAARNLQDNTTR
jgi:hypothetical protein